MQQVGGAGLVPSSKSEETSAAGVAGGDDVREVGATSGRASEA